MSAEFENNLEELEDNFEDGFEEADEVLDEIVEDFQEEEVTAETSEEAKSNTATASGSKGQLAFFKGMTIYDAMLMASALSITVACILLFLELTSFGGLFFQWRTGEAFVEPLTP